MYTVRAEDVELVRETAFDLMVVVRAETEIIDEVFDPKYIRKKVFAAPPGTMVLSFASPYDQRVVMDTLKDRVAFTPNRVRFL